MIYSFELTTVWLSFIFDTSVLLIITHVCMWHIQFTNMHRRMQGWRNFGGQGGGGRRPFHSRFLPNRRRRRAVGAHRITKGQIMSECIINFTKYHRFHKYILTLSDLYLPIQIFRPCATPGHVLCTWYLRKFFFNTSLWKLCLARMYGLPTLLIHYCILDYF